MKHRIYKVCGRSDWDVSVREGVYLGSADDRRDGFIHFSTAEQLPATVEKFFKGLSDQVLIVFDAPALGPALKLEPSRGGELFPHFYGSLPTSLALAVVPLAQGPDGVPLLPKELV